MAKSWYRKENQEKPYSSGQQPPPCAPRLCPPCHQSIVPPTPRPQALPANTSEKQLSNQPGPKAAKPFPFSTTSMSYPYHVQLQSRNSTGVAYDERRVTAFFQPLM